GRNVALRQNASQSGTYVDRTGVSTVASNAVDGTTIQDYFKGSCTHTWNSQWNSHRVSYWNLTLQRDYFITRYVLYNR
ncbi:unnamed protein product, partial [Lymnaea stagnalis]